MGVSLRHVPLNWFVLRSIIDTHYELCQAAAKIEKPKNPMKKEHSPSASEELVDALMTTSFITMAIINKIGAEHDLSLSLIRVLGILWDRRPRMTELADYLGLEKQTMSGLIARAEKRGLVVRAACKDDGRATEVFLTSNSCEIRDSRRLCH
jgi:DNA-binding MarR family transcriptional regulator